MVYDTKGGMAGTVGRQALQGATFGFSDELIDTVGYAGAKAYAKAFAPELLDEITFKEARQSSKQDIARDWQNAPVTSFASQAAGSIPFGLTQAAGNVANWASGGGKLMSAAKGGAVVLDTADLLAWAREKTLYLIGLSLVGLAHLLVLALVLLCLHYLGIYNPLSNHLINLIFPQSP